MEVTATDDNQVCPTHRPFQHVTDGQEVQHFRFLDLPVEIWTNIAAILCDRGNDEESILDPHRLDRELQKSLEQSPITRVCRTIRNEMLP
jgi:hypothetical protein